MTRQLLRTGLALSALAMLSACGSAGELAQPTPTPSASPSPTPSQTSSNVNLATCFSQTVIPGRTLQQVLIPDVVTLDLSLPAGFPNGRDLDDPVIDRLLAMSFINLTRHTLNTLAVIPINPSVFDQPIRTTFPFYAAPLGTPVLSPSTGTNFNFRTEPVSAFTRVERAGVPAISTAFIFAGARKNAYNDSTPVTDASNAFLPDITAGFQELSNGINDDLRAFGLTPCAT